MANFSTHVSSGACISFAFTTICYSQAPLSIAQTSTLFLLGTIASTLPDLDSDSGKPLQFLFATLSLILPSLFLNILPRKHAPEFLLPYFFCSYFFINYILCGIVKKCTVHRGILHSIPAGFLCAELGYLLFQQSGKEYASMVAATLFLGYCTHLLVDEIYSIDFRYGFLPRRKKSSGAAFKLWSKSRAVNVLTYLLLIGGSILCTNLYQQNVTLLGFLAGL